MSALRRATSPGTRPLQGALSWLAALGLSAGLAATYGCAKYARVEGTVVPPRATASSRSVAKTVVWVESKQRQAESSRETVVMRCTDTGFEPAWLALPAGTELRFRNQSGVFHTPFSPDPKGGFRLEPIRPGETAQVTLTHPGELHFFCELHPEATAVVMVLPAGEYAEVSQAGHFRLPSLPSGPYVVSYWHPEWGTGQRRVEVPAHGRVQLELKF